MASRKADFVHRRRGRYLAQTLQTFEELIEPHLSKEAAGDIQAFKGVVRQRFDALAHDAADVIDMEVNGAAQQLRDRLHPSGRL